MQIFRAEKIVRPKKGTNSLLNLFQQYPVRLFAITIFSILVSQITAWVLFETFIEMHLPVSYHVVSEITALTLSLLLVLFPIFYIFSYRPLLRTIEKLQTAQSHLIKVNEELVATNEREQQSRQLTEAFLLANQALSQSLDLDATADTFLEFLYNFLPYDIATILMPVNQSSWIVLKAVRRESGAFIELDHTERVDLDRLPSLKTFIDENRVQVIADTRSYEGWQQWPQGKEMHSWLGLPFSSDGSLLGMCELYKESPNYFTSEYLKLAENLVHVATNALQNAILFKQVQAGREKLQLLTHRLVKVQEEERRHLARELHDEAGQGLASLMVGLSVLEGNVNRSERVSEAIDQLKGTVSQISDKLHSVAVSLRPASLDHLGIVPILNQHVEDFAQKYDIATQFETINIHGRLSSDVETAVYRIVQEGLTNIARHGQARHASILLQYGEGKLVIIIEDDGIGFIPEAIDKTEHLGLVGIAERAEMLNGRMTIESTSGSGTTLLVEVPYEAKSTNS